MKKRKLITILLTMALIMIPGTITAHAEDSEPAPVQNTYDFDGIQYVNVGDGNFNSSQSGYYKAMLGNKLNSKDAVDEMNGEYSIGDLWTRLGFYMAHGNNQQGHENYFWGYWGSLYDDKNVTDLLYGHDEGSLVSEKKTVNLKSNNIWSLNPFEPYGVFDPEKLDAVFYRDTLRSASDETVMAKTVADTAATMVMNSWTDSSRTYFI